MSSFTDRIGYSRGNIVIYQAIEWLMENIIDGFKRVFTYPGM